jgi:hypothetical protein
LQHHFIRSITTAVRVIPIFSTAGLAQTAPKVKPDAGGNPVKPRTPDGKPDLSGVWAAPTEPGEEENLPTQHGSTARNRKNAPRFLTPWAQEQFDYAVTPTKGVYAHSARLEFNPRLAHSVSYSPGELIADAGVPLPFVILQTPRELIILYETDGMVRQIFSDGRDHPKSLELTWECNSNGH